MRLIDRILRRLGYVPASEAIHPPAVLAKPTSPDEARELTDELRRELRIIDTEIDVLRMKRRP